MKFLLVLFSFIVHLVKLNFSATLPSHYKNSSIAEVNKCWNGFVAEKFAESSIFYEQTKDKHLINILNLPVRNNWRKWKKKADNLPIANSFLIN